MPEIMVVFADSNKERREHMNILFWRYLGGRKLRKKILWEKLDLLSYTRCKKKANGRQYIFWSETKFLIADVMYYGILYTKCLKWLFLYLTKLRHVIQL